MDRIRSTTEEQHEEHGRGKERLRCFEPVQRRDSHYSHRRMELLGRRPRLWLEDRKPGGGGAERRQYRECIGVEEDEWLW